MPTVWLEAECRREGPTILCRLGHSVLQPSVRAGLSRGQPGGPAMLDGRDHLRPLLCARLDLLSRPARVYAQVFSQEPSRSLNIIVLSCSFDRWCMHVIHHSKLGPFSELLALQLGGCQEGPWAMWARKAILGPCFLRETILRIPDSSPPADVNFLEILRMQETFPCRKNLEGGRNGYDQSLKIPFLKPKSPGLVSGPGHTCSVSLVTDHVA